MEKLDITGIILKNGSWSEANYTAREILKIMKYPWVRKAVGTNYDTSNYIKIVKNLSESSYIKNGTFDKYLYDIFTSEKIEKIMTDKIDGVTYYFQGSWQTES